MRIIDLTRPILAGMLVYPSDPVPEVRSWTQRATHGYDSEVLHLGTHTGTHMDAPSHFLAQAATIDVLPMAACMLPGVLLDLRNAGGEIGLEALLRAEASLGRLVGRDEAVLLWTGWSEWWPSAEYLRDYPGLTAEGAALLAERGAGLVGIDTASVDQAAAEGFPAHRALLSKGVLIVENLKGLAALQGVGAFRFQALPLPIAGASGSPVRAVAVVGGSISPLPSDAPWPIAREKGHRPNRP